MQTQLQEIIDEFRSAEDRLHTLVERTPEETWIRRPDPNGHRWSPAECVVHLNLTAEAFLPLMEDGIVRARVLVGPMPKRHRRDFVGWLLWRTTGPPARMSVKTAARFIPGSEADRAMIIETFVRLQEAQIACVSAGDGLPLAKVRIRSAFDPRVKYNLFSCMSILPRHQHRHLWQAEEAVRQMLGSDRTD